MNKEIIRNAIIGGAIGDALGVPVEFHAPEALAEMPVTDMFGYGTHNQPPGTWSDDTSQALVLMDSVIRTKGAGVGRSGPFWSAMREGLQHWYFNGGYTAHGEVFDYGRITAEAISMLSQGEKWPGMSLNGKMDSGNGALMRQIPFSLALYAKQEERVKDPIGTIGPVIKYTILTHGSEECKLVSVYMHLLVGEILRMGTLSKWYRSRATMAPFFSFMKHFTGYASVICGGDGERFRELLTRLAKYVSASHGRAAPKASGYVLDTLASSLWAYLQGTTFTETVLTAVNLGMDADTIGSITGQLAGMTYPLAENDRLPWELDLQNWSGISETVDLFTEVLGL